MLGSVKFVSEHREEVIAKADRTILNGLCLRCLELFSVSCWFRCV